MKPFSRWLFNGIASISLLLFVAMVALWVRGSWIGDTFNFERTTVEGKDGSKALRGCQGYVVGSGIWIDCVIERIPPNQRSSPEHFGGMITCCPARICMPAMYCAAAEPSVNYKAVPWSTCLALAWNGPR